MLIFYSINFSTFKISHFLCEKIKQFPHCTDTELDFQEIQNFRAKVTKENITGDSGSWTVSKNFVFIGYLGLLTMRLALAQRVINKALPICSSIQSTSTPMARSLSSSVCSRNCHRASLGGIRRQQYLRRFPTKIVNSDGSTYTVMFPEPRKIICVSCRTLFVMYIDGGICITEHGNL